MRALLQRVDRASVEIDGDVVGAISSGLLVFLCVMAGDERADEEWLARKIVGLRIFSESDGKMSKSVLDVGGSILLVSQFTLAGDIRKGTRPSFSRSAGPKDAKASLLRLEADLRLAVPVETGRFAANMSVALVNDGPVTLWLDSRENR